jgi:cytochrome c5
MLPSVSPNHIALEAGHKSWFLSAAAGVALCAPVLGLGGWHIYSSHHEKQAAVIATKAAADEAALAYERLVSADPGAALAATDASAGRDLFVSACAMCHSPTGAGVKGLGKNLIESDFVAAQTDEQLHNFLVVGRPNATPMPMPPKGGRADLTDEDLRHLVVYLRGLQDPRRMPELAAPVLVASAAPTQADTDAALAAAGGDAELAEYIASGTKLYASACVACHGPAGAGIAGNGKQLAKNEFIASLDDDALLAFITKGRAPSDPQNTTGIQMPPKGGNPALSEDDILDIIAYLRTLQGSPITSATSSTAASK